RLDISDRRRMHEDVRARRRPGRFRQRQTRRLFEQSRLREIDCAAGGRRADSRRGHRRMDRRLASIPRRFQPHGGHPDHRRFRLRCVVDPCLHAAGAGPQRAPQHEVHAFETGIYTLIRFEPPRRPGKAGSFRLAHFVDIAMLDREAASTGAGDGGQDLVRGIGEDDFLQYPSGVLQITFALGLLFLALQAWGWSRMIVASNYGADRSKWRPKWLLVWTPRVLGAVPFVGAATALVMNPASKTWFVVALIALGVMFFAFVVWRQEMRKRLSSRAAAGWLHWLQRYCAAGSLIGAAAAMVLATLWPARIGVLVGAPAVVFFGLGFIIPVIVILVQLGSSLRIPVAGGLLAAAVLFGLWVDNHGVGRRAFAAAVTGPTDRLSLSEAYAKWKAEQ